MGRKIARDKSFPTLRLNASACSALCVCDHAVFVEGRKKFVGDHECNMHACTDTGAVFFHLFPKTKRCMAAVSSVAALLRVYMLRTYRAVILVLAINSLKVKQMVVFFCFAAVEWLRAEMILKQY